MILFTIIGRGVLAWLMTRHINSLLLFPEAFGFLVLGKSYSVAKSAVLPELVRSDLGLVAVEVVRVQVKHHRFQVQDVPVQRRVHLEGLDG